MRLKTWTLAAILIAAVTALEGQTPPWSGIIAPSRAVDWSQAGVPGGIPTRTTICATIAPEGSASAPVAPTDINNAIASCPAGQVVYLEPGSYYFSSGIDFNGKSDVTLRGAGADQTLLYFSGLAGCQGWYSGICIQNSDFSYTRQPSNLANWTGGYARGATQITLDNTAHIVPGKTIIDLDQLDDSNTDTGGIWMCETTNVCAGNGPTGATRSGRGEAQIVLATAVSGNTVTITPGLYMANWSAGKSPQAWWANTTEMGDGVEDLTVDETAVSDTGMTGGIAIDNGYGNWVSGVRVLNTQRNHVWIANSAHNTIQNSYFYGTKNASDLSYGVEEFLAADDLIANNIFQHIVAGVIPNGASTGTVVAFNYTLDDYFSQSLNYMMAGLQPHGVGVAYDLFEGNVADAFVSDDIHGPQYLGTLFRNRLIGFDTSDPARTNHTLAVELDSFNRFYNVVGNVLGDPGVTSSYSSAYPTIYFIGQTDWGGWVDPDPLVETTLLRWGNYDTVDSATLWNATDVPSSLTGSQLALFSNPVPASQALPASFFLSSMPAFWVTPFGTPPWPAIGPDVTGGDPTVSGHAYAIPAQLCYENAANDVAYPQDASGLYVKVFNAGKCYGQPPSPPTGLSAQVQ